MLDSLRVKLFKFGSGIKTPSISHFLIFHTLADPPMVLSAVAIRWFSLPSKFLQFTPLWLPKPWVKQYSDGESSPILGSFLGLFPSPVGLLGLFLPFPAELSIFSIFANLSSALAIAGSSDGCVEGESSSLSRSLFS